MDPVILAMFIGYFIITIAIGYYTSKGQKNMADFYIAGRSVGPILIAFSSCATIASGFFFVGLPGLAYLFGYQPMFQIPVNAILAYVIVFGLLARPMRVLSERYDLLTVPDLFEHVYQSRALRWISSIIIIVGIFGFMVSQWVAMGMLFQTLLKSTYITGLIVGVVVVGFYVTLGGQKGNMWISAFQLVIMMLGSVLAMYYGFKSVGGFTELNKTLAQYNPEVLKPWSESFGLGFYSFLSFFILYYEDIYRGNIEILKSATGLKNYIALKNLGKASCDRYYETVINYENNSPCKCEELNPEDIYLIIHTGGTTGMPKGAMISHRAVLFNALNNVMDWGLNCKDTVHLLLPLFHTGGWNILTLALLMVGGRLIINKGFDPKLALRIINDEKPSYIFGAATIFRMIYEQPEFDTNDWSSLKWVMSGAAPTPIQVMEKFWGKGIRICAGYGLTEGGPMNLGTPMDFMSMDQIKEKYASVGKPFYFTIAKIVNDDGTETDVDEVGELIFTGPQIFSGYWNNEKETQKTMKDGWIYTGDMAKKDKDGFYYIVGRKKNMFISGGENVFPPEIEKILYEMNEIHEVSVIGVPDEKWGEVGKAVISLKPGKYLNKEDVISYLKKKLAHYKIPKYVTFVTEVPKNSVGKIVSAKVVKLHGKPED